MRYQRRAFEQPGVGTSLEGAIYQINVKGEERDGNGLRKPAVEASYAETFGLRGDHNHYRTDRLAGDPDQALLLIPRETLRELNREGWPAGPGELGENITTIGLAYREFAVGRRFALGAIEIEITKACRPCRKLHTLSWVGGVYGPEFLKTMQGRRGWYARVLVAGPVQTGDRIRWLSG